MIHLLPTHHFGTNFHLDHTVFNQIVLEPLVFDQINWHHPGGTSNHSSAPHLAPESLIYLESRSNSPDKIRPITAAPLLQGALLGRLPAIPTTDIITRLVIPDLRKATISI